MVARSTVEAGSRWTTGFVLLFVIEAHVLAPANGQALNLHALVIVPVVHSK